MHVPQFIFLAVAALPSVAQAVGNAIVKNNCANPIYLWSVGSSVGPEQTINKGGQYSEAFHRDPTTGGIALKITAVQDGLYNGSPQTIFSYNLDPTQVWYDLSDIFGDAFAGKPILIRPSDGNCQPISWPQGTNPGGSQVKVCESGTDLVMTIC